MYMLDMHWAYPERWSGVIEEDVVVEKPHIDEASAECPSRSDVVRERAAGSITAGQGVRWCMISKTPLFANTVTVGFLLHI